MLNAKRTASNAEKRIAITAIKTSVRHNINVRGVRPASVIVCVCECIRVCLRACICVRHLNKPILIGEKRARSVFCGCGQKSAVCFMRVCVFGCICCTIVCMCFGVYASVCLCVCVCVGLC